MTGAFLWTHTNKNEMEKEFVIRSYSYCELAMLYFPNSTKKSASAQLGRWIRENQKLKNELTEMGLKPGKKILTPRHVKLIVELLGNPWQFAAWRSGGFLTQKFNPLTEERCSYNAMIELVIIKKLKGWTSCQIAESMIDKLVAKNKFILCHNLPSFLSVLIKFLGERSNKSGHYSRINCNGIFIVDGSIT